MPRFKTKDVITVTNYNLCTHFLRQCQELGGIIVLVIITLVMYVVALAFSLRLLGLYFS